MQAKNMKRVRNIVMASTVVLDYTAKENFNLLMHIMALDFLSRKH